MPANACPVRLRGYSNGPLFAIRRVRLVVRTQPSQGWCTGSTPVRGATYRDARLLTTGQMEETTEDGRQRTEHSRLDDSRFTNASSPLLHSSHRLPITE